MRAFPEHLPLIDYPGHYLAKRVTNCGTFRLKHKLLFIACALKQQYIGLEEIDDGVWSIYFKMRNNQPDHRVPAVLRRQEGWRNARPDRSRLGRWRRSRGLLRSLARAT